MDLNSQAFLFDPKWETAGPTSRSSQQMDKRFLAMVALQKWLAKEKRESLPKYSVAKKVVKLLDTKDPEWEREIDHCHKHLMQQEVRLKVCTGSSCQKHSDAKTGAKVRATLSLEGPVAVMPSPCLGHCKQGPCMQVEKGKQEVVLGNVKKEADFQKVLKALEGDLKDLGPFALKRKKLAAL